MPKGINKARISNMQKNQAERKRRAEKNKAARELIKKMELMDKKKK